MIKNRRKQKNHKFKLTASIVILLLTAFFTTACGNVGSDNSYNNEKTPAVSENEENKNLVDLNGVLKVHYINVAQGDAILIQCDDENMIIDAGKNNKAGLVDYYLKEQGVEKLDYVVGTHPHEDHIGGLDLVIDTYDIGTILMPKITATTQTFKDLITSINNKDLKITEPIAGTTYELGKATFEILAPNSSDYSDTNNYSIVIKLTYGDTSFLFTGDCEDVSEEEMVAKGLDLKADVLKIGHHGSRDSTIDEFLLAVDPMYAVISVGRVNTYGHPHKRVMDKLKEKNIDVYRTDESGTVIASSDGNNITFNTSPDSYDYRDGDKSGLVDDNDDSNYPDGSNNNLSVETTNDDSEIFIANIDKVGEIVTIKNNSNKDQNLKGWTLLSVTGNQEYIFEDFIIEAGTSITIASGKAQGDIKWGTANIWNNTGDDNGILKDNNGNIISKFTY
ncbi:MBL fold metallo-hydrolase [Clostridium grantii]|uniref:Metal-dependent hydrolase, beta-lactamase superfamily II n=1 Tax=Clostridium grantii DSM 8605 TaxID=1121316 RepID=A0A1M5R074_9CLOT|nr:MBL fold metallo-hydrolase [Clostridium grantii]SHH19558.1 Metal-dependent hydrolase, beta-lactamase superfamily II [Clostridium grantii DSM 8605]